MQRQQEVGDVEAGRGRVEGAGEVDGGTGACHRVGRRAGPGQEHSRTRSARVTASSWAM